MARARRGRIAATAQLAVGKRIACARAGAARSIDARDTRRGRRLSLGHTLPKLQLVRSARVGLSVAVGAPLGPWIDTIYPLLSQSTRSAMRLSSARPSVRWGRPRRPRARRARGSARRAVAAANAHRCAHRLGQVGVLHAHLFHLALVLLLLRELLGGGRRRAVELAAHVERARHRRVRRQPESTVDAPAVALQHKEEVDEKKSDRQGESPVELHPRVCEKQAGGGV